MIDLPPGFDVALLFNDLFLIATPFVGTGFLIAAGFLIMNVFKKI
jgi:hypothetical protein